jgi:hypothetical protein
LSKTIVTQPAKTHTGFLRAAIGYVQLLNWPVFPLKPKDKTPISKGGFHSATTDIEQITKWWTDHPQANIGIPTGKASGFVVLDVDPRHGGDESLQELIDKYGDLPDTVEAITGGGGRHILFRNQEGIGNKTNFLPGLDARGTGGYIVVSPSLHSSGKRYSWELSSRPDEVPLNDIPDWLLHTLKDEPAEGQRKPKDHWLKVLQGSGDGERNNTTTSLAGHLLSHGINAYVALEILLLWDERNSPPQGREVVEKTFYSVLRKEIKRRKERGAWKIKN